MCSHRYLKTGPATLAILFAAWLWQGGLACADEPSPTPGEPVAEVADHEAADHEAADREAEAPAAEADKEPAAAAEDPVAAPHKLRFQFRFQPWKDVLNWFAEQADLSLVMDSPPQGTFNYSDNREYTPAEAIDLLNGVLLTKGYTLIRRNRMLMLINLEDGIPPNLVSTVPLDEIDDKGEFEVVSVLFDLETLKPEEAEAEIRKLTGPQGSVVALNKSRQIFVTETAGRLRAIRDLLSRIEGPEGSASAGFRACHLKSARPEELMPTLRHLFDIPEDKSATADGSVRIAADAASGRLFVSGQPEKVARVMEVVKGLDVPAAGGQGAGQAAATPQIEVYPITGADPQSVLTVLQTLLTGMPEVRLLIDPKTNNLVAMAKPAQHATIRATLMQLQGDVQRVEVIRLMRNDPEAVASSINKLFGSADGKAPAPQVDVNVANRQLIVRGNDAQLVQIRNLLEKMGESLPTASDAQDRRVRTLPYGSAAGRSALVQIREIWPNLRPNRIQVITPSSGNPPARPGDAKRGEEPTPEILDLLRRMQRRSEKPQTDAAPQESPADHPADHPGDRPADPVAEPTSGGPETPAAEPSGDRSARLAYGASIVFVGQQSEKTPAERDSPPVVVVPGPHGLVIASDDTEALDEFERLMDMLADNPSGGRAITVFYLKYAKAAGVTESLGQVLGGTGAGATSSRRSDSGGDMGGMPFGAMGGMPFGGMPFGGRGGSRRSQNSADAAPESGAAAVAISKTGQGGLATGPIKITPDQRLNALLVQANQADVDTIEELLKILDQKESPEDILVAPKPRMIAVQHTKAQELAEIVKQVYADRMVQGGGSSGQQPSFPFFMRSRFGGSQQQTPQASRNDDTAKLSIGIDARTNSLIVAAPDALFQEVKQLVEQLDVAAGDQNESVRVVTLHRTSPMAVERALAAIAGDSVQINRTGGPAAGDARPGGSPYQQPSRDQGQANPWRSRYNTPGQQPGGAPGYYNPSGQQGGRGSRRGGSYGYGSSSSQSSVPHSH